MGLYSCSLVRFGELPGLYWDLKVTGPLLLLFFALVKFFLLILLEQRRLLGALSVSLFIVVLPGRLWGKAGIPDK